MNRELKIGLMISIATILLFFLALEIVLRIVYPDNPEMLWQPDQELWIVHAPNFTTTIKAPYGETRVTTNSFGMRDKEIMPKQLGQYRILVVGDSITFGLGIALDETYPRVLERKLKAALPTKNIEVLNFGIPAYGTDRELIYLKYHIDRIQPDLIVLGFYVANDISDNLAGQRFRVEGGRLIKNTEYLDNKIELRRASYQLKKTFYSYAWLSDRLYFLIRVINEWINLHVPVRLDESIFRYELLLKDTPPRILEGWKLTAALVGEMASTAKAHGAEFMMLIIPDDIQYDRRKWEQMKAVANLRDADVDLNKSVEEALAMCTRLEVNCINPLPRFKEEREPLTWENDPHANVRGHEVMADGLAKHLIELGILEISIAPSTTEQQYKS